MAINFKDTKANKVLVGDNVIMQSGATDSWIPLITPDDTVTETAGLLKDLHNGTVQIMLYRLGTVKWGTVLFTVPDGYKLTGMEKVDGAIRFGNSSNYLVNSQLLISSDGKSLVSNGTCDSGNNYLYGRASRESYPFSPINRCIFDVEYT